MEPMHPSFSQDGDDYHAVRNRRSRKNGTSRYLSEEAHDDTNDDHGENYSVVSLLAVPLEVIFREVGNINSVGPGPPASNGRKPWITTRAEAQCMLRVSMLARELDLLIRLSEQALSEQQWRRQFQEQILHAKVAEETQDDSDSNIVHPYFKCLLPILRIQEQFTSLGCLEYVQKQLEGVLSSLGNCARTLRTSFEYNYMFADRVLDSLQEAKSPPPASNARIDQNNSSTVLAREAKKLAELQEELCHRIESLIRDTGGTDDERASDPATSKAYTRPPERSLSDASSHRGMYRSRNLLTDCDLKPLRDVCARILGSNKRGSCMCNGSKQKLRDTSTSFARQRTRFTSSEVDANYFGPPSKRLKAAMADHLGEASGSQNSQVKRSRAAEALAVLAFSPRFERIHDATT